MPSNKKTPLKGGRKKVTASARARISTRKIRKSVNGNTQGSYLEEPEQTVVSTTTSSHPISSASSGQEPTSVIISMLQQLSESNQSLIQRVDRIEQRNASDHVSINQTSQSSEHPLQGHGPLASTSRLPQPHQFYTPTQAQPIGNGVRPRHPATIHAPLPQQGQGEGIQNPRAPGVGVADIQTDGVVPTLEAIRRMPTISDTVSNLLASYEDQAKASIQGRQHRKSGRYNSTDMALTAPEFRWPNEGFHGQTGKKKTVYDDLTLPQWITGQLTNIYHMRDQNTARHALLQVILAMKDATSLPWTAVRNAWATSMHDLEEGHLGWHDSTQWAINRLSASQISIANSQVAHPTQPKKICKFFNEGTCSHDSNHGGYRHVCHFCDKQGKSFNHPESKCMNKTKNKDRQQTNS